ncbi:hypothetical protein HRG_005206 [Hirsutella rhossiliensis]|uniref:Uncharacterized protein n=1 Tax=Hirsutella rhossiliensis TaxID=111463 RepID=A0A9P8MYM8_9HYPO|nr:uncharacterized protein HRG_05206 [Hirsutella rhossiliensis]KAH0962696.1 hypothetical protein HRG_05206 [Hirsutella rhossiliensis]
MKFLTIATLFVSLALAAPTAETGKEKGSECNKYDDNKGYSGGYKNDYYDQKGDYYGGEHKGVYKRGGYGDYYDDDYYGGYYDDDYYGDYYRGFGRRRRHHHHHRKHGFPFF